MNNDHLPDKCHNHSHPVLRWDKADLGKYYKNTGLFLQSIHVPIDLIHCSACNCSEHKSIINNYYKSIINALKQATMALFPGLPLIA